MHICQIKTKVISGENSLAVFKECHKQRVLFICDKFLEKNKTIFTISKYLDESNAVEIFADILPEPTLAVIASCIARAAHFKPTLIVAVGGGAALDTAKGVVYFATIGKVWPKPTFIAIPTTSGTGSEMTNFAVFTDEVKQTKSVVVDDLMYADVAVLAPELTVSVPPVITANTGFDVITHALEAYVTPAATNFTTALAAKSLELAFCHLPLCYNQGESLQARAGMLEASSLAGMAFTLSGLGLAHSLAHQLGGVFHLPHGLACALALSAVIEYNAKEEGAAKHYAKAAFTAGVAPSQASEQEAVKMLLATLKALQIEMQMPLRVGTALPDVSFAEYSKQLPHMAQLALADRCLPGNPRQVVYKDVVELLEKLY